MSPTTCFPPFARQGFPPGRLVPAFVLLLCLQLRFASAQTSGTPYPVGLSMAAASLDDRLPPTVGPALDQRLAAQLAVSRAGNRPVRGFVVLPYLELSESFPVEGVQTRTAARLSLVLVLRNSWDDSVLATDERTLSGIGADLSAAVRQAIQAIGRGPSDLTQVREDFEAAARTYLDSRCLQLLDQATEDLDGGAAGRAFALLQAMPAGSPCHAKTQSLRETAYQRYQAAACGQLLLEAAAHQAGRDYRSALQALAAIDASGPCTDQANAAVDALHQHLDNQLRQEYDWLLKLRTAAAAGESARWEAMEALFLHWLRQHPPNWPNP